MQEDAIVWINIVTAVVSLVLGSILTFTGQFFSDRRILARDALAYARKEKSEWRAFERQNYLEIQDEMVKLSDTTVALHQMKGHASEKREQYIADLSHLNHRIRALAERCPDASLRDGIHGWLDLKDRELRAAPGDEYRERRLEAGNAYVEVQRLIGSAIRREPTGIAAVDLRRERHPNCRLCTSIPSAHG
jgi:hypothetical protein